MSDKQTILVTGATGFLGSHVLAALTPDKDRRIIAACRKPSKLPPDFHGEIGQGDLTDSNYVEQVTQGVASSVIPLPGPACGHTAKKNNVCFVPPLWR